MKKTIIKRGLIAGVGAVVTGSLLFGLTGVLAEDPGASPATSTGISPTFNGIHVEGVIDNTAANQKLLLSDQDGIKLQTAYGNPLYEMYLEIVKTAGAPYLHIGAGGSPDGLDISSEGVISSSMDEVIIDDDDGIILGINAGLTISGNGIITDNNGDVIINDPLTIRGRIQNDLPGEGVSITDSDGVILGSETDGLRISYNGHISSPIIIQIDSHILAHDSITAAGPHLDVRGQIMNSTGDVYINDSLDVTGLIDARNGISDSTGDLYINDNLDVTGLIDARGGIFDSTGDVYIDDNLSITGQTVINGTTYLNGHLDSDGDTIIFDTGIDLNNDLNVTGNISDSTGDVSISDNLVVTGSIDAQNGIFDSTGYVTINDRLTATDYINAQMGIYNANADNVYISDKLSVLYSIYDYNSSSVTIDDGLIVNGKITSTGAIGTYSTVIPSGTPRNLTGSGSTRILTSCPTGQQMVSCSLVGTSSTGATGGTYNDIVLAGSNIYTAADCALSIKNTSSSTKYYKESLRCFDPSI